MATTLLEADLPGLPLRHRGKVRDVFELPADNDGPRLLIVATDRLSAFDVVLPDPIPGKGEMLCQISNFWFARTAHIVPNHLTGADVASVLPPGVDPALYAQRAVVTRKLKPVNPQPGFRVKIVPYLYKSLLGMLYTDGLSALYHATAIRELQP